MGVRGSNPLPPIFSGYQNMMNPAKRVGRWGIVFSLTVLPLLWCVNYGEIFLLSFVGMPRVPDILAAALLWLLIWPIPAYAGILLIGSIALLLGRPWSKPTCLVGLKGSLIQTVFAGSLTVIMGIMNTLEWAFSAPKSWNPTFFLWISFVVVGALWLIGRAIGRLLRRVRRLAR